MTQANKLSLNFPSLRPLVLSFINWTANVVLIFSHLLLNLKWPGCLLFMALSYFSLTFLYACLTLLVFFPPSLLLDEWTGHSVSRYPRSWQWRDSVQVSICLYLLPRNALRNVGKGFFNVLLASIIWFWLKACISYWFDVEEWKRFCGCLSVYTLHLVISITAMMYYQCSANMTRWHRSMNRNFNSCFHLNQLLLK